jgi:hypothetical protein
MGVECYYATIGGNAFFDQVWTIARHGYDFSAIIKICEGDVYRMYYEIHSFSKVMCL